MKCFLAALAFLLCVAPAWARLPTEANYTTLATDITVTNAGEFAAAVAANDDQTIANAYNLAAAVTCWVWRTDVPKSDIYAKTSVDATTWSWATYQSQSVAEKDAWGEMFYTGSVNMSLPNNQAAVSAIFSGSGSPATQRIHIFTISRRVALRAEKLFATGPGNCTTGTPSTMVFEGSLTGRDVAHALRGVPLQ